MRIMVSTEYCLPGQSLCSSIERLLRSICHVTRGSSHPCSNSMLCCQVRAWGYTPLLVSCESGMGLGQVDDVLRGRTSVVTGPSGKEGRNTCSIVTLCPRKPAWGLEKYQYPRCVMVGWPCRRWKVVAYQLPANGPSPSGLRCPGQPSRTVV